MASPPQEGGAKSCILNHSPFSPGRRVPIAIGKGMRPTDMEEGVLKTIGIGGEIEIHQEKTKELYSRPLSYI